MKPMNPNDFGKKYLTEQCQKIRITDFIKSSNKQIRAILIRLSLEEAGHNVLLKKSVTGFGGARLWFSCPICNKRVGVLYKHPISHILGCRKCLRLDYRKHRYRGMIESEAG